MIDSRSRSIRLWPALVVIFVGLLAGLLVWFWPSETANRQARVMTVMGIALLTVLLLLAWWTFASRLSWRTRTFGLAGVATLCVIFTVCFEQVGVTGDLVPVFRFRWASEEPDRVRRAEDVERSTHADLLTYLGDRERSGRYTVPDLPRDWEARPPMSLWDRKVGPSFSGFAVSGSTAVTLEQAAKTEDGTLQPRDDGAFERAAAYDLDSGMELWSHGWEARYDSPVAGIGPRATPTIEDERVFVLGALGDLRALRLDTGELLWKRRLTEDHACEVPEWGYSGSPLVVDDLVIVSPGGSGGHSLAAYAVEDGRLVWHAGDDGAGYAAPMLATLCGVRQVVIFNASSVAGHDPETGAQLWSHPWGGERPQCAQPLVLSENRLLVSTGYSLGSCLVELQRDAAGTFTTRTVWRSIRMRSKFANLLHEGGAIFGLDDGTLACLDPEDGKRLWKDGRFGHGQLAGLGNHLLVQTEEGELVLVAYDREALRVVTRMQPLEGRTWNPPTIAWPYVLVRNERRAVCLRFPIDA